MKRDKDAKPLHEVPAMDLWGNKIAYVDCVTFKYHDQGVGEWDLSGRQANQGQPPSSATNRNPERDQEYGGLKRRLADRSRSPAYMGSPYVPLDSWIYPAIERLAAFGFIRTASLGLRPWTRLECASGSLLRALE